MNVVVRAAAPSGRRPLATLRRFAREAAAVSAAALEHCDFCGEPIPRQHRHLLEVAPREVTCVCYPCSILFNNQAASQGRFRLIPDRRLYLPDFRMTDAQWQGLRVPVGMAFFFHGSAEGQVMAFYPGPMGAVEAALEADIWREVEENYPLLRAMEPDVEALLANRTRGAAEYFLVPVDECYRLVATIRSTWRGLSGGQDVWKAVDAFFTSLKARSRAVASTMKGDHA